MNEKIPSLKTKRITIDDLATMVNNGFKEADKNLHSVVDSAINSAVDSLEERLNKRIDSLETRMDMGFKGLQAQIDNMAINNVTLQEHNFLANRVKKIERKIGIN